MNPYWISSFLIFMLGLSVWSKMPVRTHMVGATRAWRTGNKVLLEFAVMHHHCGICNGHVVSMFLARLESKISSFSDVFLIRRILKHTPELPVNYGLIPLANRKHNNTTEIWVRVRLSCFWTRKYCDELKKGTLPTRRIVYSYLLLKCKERSGTHTYTRRHKRTNTNVHTRKHTHTNTKTLKWKNLHCF